MPMFAADNKGTFSEPNCSPGEGGRTWFACMHANTPHLGRPMSWVRSRGRKKSWGHLVKDTEIHRPKEPAPRLTRNQCNQTPRANLLG